MPHLSTSFQSILVPLDGSSLAERALPLASVTAQGAGSRLRLVLAHRLLPAPLDLPAAKTYAALDLAIRKSERGYLRNIQARLRDGGIRLSSAITLAGEPGPALAEYVRELGIDLVVMATHGRGGVRRAWLGSVADYLIRHLEIPVLLVRPPEHGVPAERPGGVGQILVPLDGSPLAEQALDAAVGLARCWKAELTLLNVVLPVMSSSEPILPLPSAYDEELTEASRAQAQDYLDDIIERLQAEGLRASGAAVVGWSAVDTILGVARPERVSAVVVATHGRGGLSRLVLGSVADKLIRGADVPVMVYRPAGSGKPSKGSSPRGALAGREGS